MSATGNVAFDPETDEVIGLESERESISRIYLAKEPMHVVYQIGETHKEFDVKKDDIIIKFYERTFENPVVVVKSKDWVKNLKKYNEQQQKIAEEWAKEKAASAGCDNKCESAD